MIDDNIVAQIRELVIEGAGIRFKGCDFRSLCGPQVYLFTRHGLPLYVGMSGAGMSRCASRGHKQADKARAECDRVLVYPCRTRDDACTLEQILIQRMQPKYNKNQRAGVLALHKDISLNRARALYRDYMAILERVEA